MAEPQEKITDETRAVGERDAQAAHGAPADITPEEEAAAERLGGASEETKENYEEALERGANAKGEGRLP
jgi:hypothetical protein